MTNSRLILGSLIFTFLVSFLVSEISGTTYEIISPLTLSVISIPLIAVISASNTPIIKGSALAILFSVITGFIILSEIPIYIFGFVIVPIFISVGLAFADIGS